MRKTYTIKANRTASDVVKNNDIALETGYTLEEAKVASIEYQRTGHYVAVWIEEEETKPAPRVVRSIESACIFRSGFRRRKLNSHRAVSASISASTAWL